MNSNTSSLPGGGSNPRSVSAERGLADRVLVVGGSPHDVGALRIWVSEWGGTLVEAADGARTAAAATRQCPTIALVAARLPDTEGTHVCRALREDPRTRHVRTVLLVEPGYDVSRCGLDHEADDFLVVPLVRGQVIARLRALARGVRTGVSVADAARGDVGLLAALVHDLRNPLTAVAANLDLLERRAPEDVAHLVTRCRSGATRLHRMLLDLLDLSRLQGGSFTLSLDEVEIESLVRRVLEDAAENSLQRQVRLDSSFPANGATVRIDVALARRIVDALIANALERSPRGTTVRIEVARVEDGIAVDVSDQGPPIPEGERRRIFDPVSRSASGMAGITVNRGLRLTFSRLAAEALKGSVRVEPGADGLTRFRLVLPASAAVASPVLAR